MQGHDADVYKLDCLQFYRHMKAIAQGLTTRPVTAFELLTGHSEGRQLLLTFDDGGVSALSYVADILDEFGWKAHFLITANRIATPGFLDSGQIRELHRRGHIIGSHSFSHPARMSFCTTAELDAEWGQSVNILSEIIGEQVVVASVPGGYYSRRVAASAARCGIQLLFNSESGVRPHFVEGCLVLGRFTMKRGSAPRRSAAILAGAWWPQVQQYLFWNCKKVLKTLGGRVWLRARIFLLALRARVFSRRESGSSV
jgi:peptidoglycan/xylan/chitin deacetylase (PgdA/CDA1 family)